MRIEVINGRSAGTATVSGLQSDLSVLLNETDSVISALKAVKKYSYSINGGVGILNDAVNDIDLRIQNEESKRNDLQNVQKKCGDFIELVTRTDRAAAKSVSLNREEFYRVNEWSKPSVTAAAVEKWYNSAKKWLEGMVRQGADWLSHSWNVYNEVDFSKLTADQLNQYSSELLNRMNSGDENNDDHIRLKALFNYVSKNSMKNKALFLKLYEKMHPEKMQEIRDSVSGLKVNYSEEQKLIIEYYMANGTSLSSAQKLCRELSRTNNIAGDQYQLTQSENNKGIYQGNFWIGNFYVSHSTDGTCQIKAVARQSPPAISDGAVIVYDESGNVKYVKILNSYKHPTDFASAAKTIWNDWHNKNYEETLIDICIPRGGYAKFTDDPYVLEEVESAVMMKKVQQSVSGGDSWETAADLTSDDIKITGNAAGSYVKYGENTQTAADIMKWAAETTGSMEKKFWSDHQKGSGSCYIYNH